MANKTNHKKALNKEHETYIENNYKQYSLVEIARILKVSYNSVWKYADKKGICFIAERIKWK